MAELGGVGDDLLPFQNSELLLKDVVSFFFFDKQTHTHKEVVSKIINTLKILFIDPS